MPRLATLALLLSLLFCLSLSAAEKPNLKRPNVVLVMTDDQGYGDMGCHGNRVVKTVALDMLHRESIRLTNFHVDPTCSPTRAALMTGRYSARTGVWHTIMGRSILRRDEMTMADLFAKAGYRTAIFGKWHLGDNYPYRADGPRLPGVAGPRRRRHRPDARLLGQHVHRPDALPQRQAGRSRRATAPTSSSTPRSASSRPTARSRSSSTFRPTCRTGRCRCPRSTAGRTSRRA